jgi:hypothetical protein
VLRDVSLRVVQDDDLPLAGWRDALFEQIPRSDIEAAMASSACGFGRPIWLRPIPTACRQSSCRASSRLRPTSLRLAPIADFARTSLQAFIGASTAPGASVKTDGLAAYLGAPNVAHQPHVVATMAAHVVLPGIHRVFSNLKTWALGVYHGLRRKHLKAYLDEFVFRFNRRHTRHAGFATLLAIAMTIKPKTYNDIIQLGSTG